MLKGSLGNYEYSLVKGLEAAMPRPHSEDLRWRVKTMKEF